MRMTHKIGDLVRRLRRISWNVVAKDRRGIAAVEFAILVPVLILLAVCTIDLGLAIYANMRVESSAEAGSGYAMLHGFDSTAISSAVTSAGNLSGLTASPAPTQFCGCPGSSGITSAICGTTCGTNIAGTYVRASATYTYHTLMSYPIIPSQYTFASTSTVRIK
jgi:Flp pilus assembly protein TadG